MLLSWRWRSGTPTNSMFSIILGLIPAGSEARPRGMEPQCFHGERFMGFARSPVLASSSQVWQGTLFFEFIRVAGLSPRCCGWNLACGICTLFRRMFVGVCQEALRGVLFCCKVSASLLCNLANKQAPARQLQPWRSTRQLFAATLQKDKAKLVTGQRLGRQGI